MTGASQRAVEDCLIDVFQNLGIDRAHIVAGQQVATDWLGLVTKYAERVASLSLVSPRPRPELRGLRCPLLVLAGDKGETGRFSADTLAEVPGATSLLLNGYECLPWADLAADRSEAIERALSDFLAAHPIAPISLPEGRGEVAGITYRIRGSGAPLVFAPLDLAPSQWEPLIPTLGVRFCTITLGGAALGAVSLLEGRGRSGYLGAIQAVLDQVAIQPGEVILEVGGGSGVALREVARRSGGANPIIDVDISPYLLREAAALAEREGLAAQMSFNEGSAEALPLADQSVDVALSFTVMEEGDADTMLAELIRVTRPGGRIGVIVRSLDMPWWANLPLSIALRTKVDQPGSRGSGVAIGGCGDAGLYRRFAAAGLHNLKLFPQLVVREPAQLVRLEAH